MMGNYDTGGWGWGSWLLMSLMMLVILALIAWGLFLIWRASAGGEGAGSPPRPPTPEAILRERLARGEIDPEEYRQRLEALRAKEPSANG